MGVCMKSISVFLVLSATWLLSAPALGGQEVGEDTGMSALAMVTGFHVVVHKASGFQVRLLEADGSASVAWDPVSLFVVVSNNGTSDLQQRVWRLPNGVERVRAITPTACGVDVRVEVDRIKDAMVVGRDQRTLRLCFLSAQGSLLSRLSVAELGLVNRQRAEQKQ